MFHVFALAFVLPMWVCASMRNAHSRDWNSQSIVPHFRDLSEDARLAPRILCWMQMPG